MNPDFGYPYDPTDGREDLAAPDFVARVLRGGAYFNHQGLLRCASRYGWYLEDRYGNGGFRVCAPGP
jgi:formylglycine-generating enzyme required for sulfatase activity